MGTCSECGLSFPWTDLDSGRLHTPRFSYEHGAEWDAWRFIGTFARAMLGWPLWTRLRMEHDIVGRRLVVFVAASGLLLHFLAAAIVLYGAWRGLLTGWTPDSVVRAAASWTGGAPPTPPATSPPDTAFFAGGWWGTAWPVTWAEAGALVAWPYDHGFWLTLPGVPSMWVTTDGAMIAGCIIVQAGTPAVLLGLRQTRRRFRLRSVHLIRGLCLAAPLVFTILVLGGTITNGVWLAWQGDPSDTHVRLGLAATSCGVCLAVSICWWWMFTRWYLKAPHAFGIALAGGIIGSALALLVAVMLKLQALFELL